MAWSKTVRISIMLAIDVAFFLLELGTGIYVGSLALMADAFHMLNDVISLVVGLWAVRVAQKATTDKFSYGWLRAEILGAFFNAVFLIALCVSILLEALTRFIDPPEISNPFLILVVGCMGLLSNLVGFFVLGGHSHGGHDDEDEHEHEHEQVAHHGASQLGNDSLRDAEEGQAASLARQQIADEQGRPADLLPEVAVASFPTSVPAAAGHVAWIERGGDGARAESADIRPSKGSARSKGQHRRRASSGRVSRFANIEDLSIHPASFRQEIIAASRPQDLSEDSASEDNGDGGAGAGEDTTGGHHDRNHCDLAGSFSESAPLLGAAGRDGPVKSGLDDCYGATRRGPSRRPRRDSILHDHHNHNKPRRSHKDGGHGHGHGHSHGDMGMQAMVLHVIGDALGNVGVIVTALIIWKTTWPGRFYADPAVSLFITLIILRSAVPLTLATAKILLQATPDHIDVNDIKADIQDLPGVLSCHHVHIWQLSDTKIVASMHVQVAFPISDEGGERYMNLARRARSCLHAYGIHSATIQPEFCSDDSHGHSLPQGPTQPTNLLMSDGAPSKPASACGNGGPGSICLLECVDNCVGQGCCSPPSGSPPGTSHSTHDSPHTQTNHDDHHHSDGHHH